MQGKFPPGAVTIKREGESMPVMQHSWVGSGRVGSGWGGGYGFTIKFHDDFGIFYNLKETRFQNRKLATYCLMPSWGIWL